MNLTYNVVRIGTLSNPQWEVVDFLEDRVCLCEKYHNAKLIRDLLEKHT